MKTLAHNSCGLMKKKIKFYPNFLFGIVLIQILLLAQLGLFAQVSDFKVNETQGSLVGFDWNVADVSLAVNDSGSFVIAWSDGHNDQGAIYAQRYSSDGLALGNNFKVSDGIHPIICPNGDECLATPSISAAANGDFVIAWMDLSNINEDEVNIYAQRFLYNGTPVGSNFKVNNMQWAVYPSVSAGNTGNFVITWSVPGDAVCNGWDIYAQRYASDGSPMGSNLKVNSIEGICNEKPSVVMDQNGKFVITWAGWGDDYRNIYAQRYSSDGEPLGSNFIVNDEPGFIWGSYSGTTPTTIAMDSSGNFVIAWAGNRGCESWGADIYAQSFSNDGVSLGNNIKVNDDNVTCSQYFSSVSMDKDGNFVIAWNDSRNNDLDIYAQCFTKEGNKLGDNYLVTSTSDSLQRKPSVKLWNGRIYTAWADNRNAALGYDVWANILERDFPVKIEDPKILAPSGFNLSQNYPNPFSSTTIISYQLTIISDVELSVYDLLGKKITTLVEEKQQPGRHEVDWSAFGMKPGVYWYELKTGQARKVMKMILLRE
jgi:hypothetical protein